MASLLYYSAGAAAGVVEGCLYVASLQLKWLWGTSPALQAKVSLEAALEESEQQLGAVPAEKQEAQAEAAHPRSELHGGLVEVAGLKARLNR
eukprot:jgi/Chrzof1/7544/Cz02g27220.t1